MSMIHTYTCDYDYNDLWCNWLTRGLCKTTILVQIQASQKRFFCCFFCFLFFCCRVSARGPAFGEIPIEERLGTKFHNRSSTNKADCFFTIWTECLPPTPFLLSHCFITDIGIQSFMRNTHLCFVRIYVSYR